MRSKLFPDCFRELISFAGEKGVGYEAVGENWYQLDIHQFNQLREGEAEGGEMYEVAVQFRVYLVTELRGVLVVVDVNPQVFVALSWLFGVRVDGRKCEAAWALEVMSFWRPWQRVPRVPTWAGDYPQTRPRPYHGER